MRPQSGSAELRVGTVGGHSAVLCSRAKSPLCLLTPHSRGASVWAYTSSLGGGMVAGDEVSLQVAIDPGARCFLGTQSSSKIYRNPQKRGCSQSLHATIANNSLLVLAPDPVQCFAESSYEQRQNFELAAEGNLVLLDWISAGRIARGERWAFRRYFSRNQIKKNGDTIFLDALELDEFAGANKFQTGRFNCVATLVITGPLVESHAKESLSQIQEIEIQPGSSVICAASPISGGVVIRLAGSGLAEVGSKIHSHLRFIRTLLADDPWLRKW